CRPAQTRDPLRKPSGGSASSTRCGKSRSFVRRTVSLLRRIVLVMDDLRCALSLYDARYRRSRHGFSGRSTNRLGRLTLSPTSHTAHYLTVEVSKCFYVHTP